MQVCLKIKCQLDCIFSSPALFGDNFLTRTIPALGGTDQSSFLKAHFGIDAHF